MQVAESTADLSDILGPVDDDDTGLGASPPRVAAPPQIQWTPFGERRKLYKPRYLGALETTGRDEAQGTSRGARREGPPHLLPREAVRAERELLFAEKQRDAERETQTPRYWHAREANGGWQGARAEGRPFERRGVAEQQLERPYAVREARRTLSAGNGGLYHGDFDPMPAGTRAGWADVHARQQGLYESRSPGTPRRHTAGHARQASGPVRGHARQWSQSSASSGGRSGGGGSSSGSRDVTVDRMEEDIKLTQDILAALSDRIGLNQTMLDKLLHKGDGQAQTPPADLGKWARRDILLDQEPKPEQEVEQESAPEPRQALGVETIATKSESPVHAGTRQDAPEMVIKTDPELFQWRADHNGSPSEFQRNPGPALMQDIQPAALETEPRAESQSGVRRRTIGPRTVSESDKAVQTEWSFPVASDDLPRATSTRQQRETARRTENKARLAAIKTRLANTASNPSRQPNRGIFTSALAWIVSLFKTALSLPVSALYAIIAAVSTCYYAVLSVFTNLCASSKRRLSAITPQPAAVTRVSKTTAFSLKQAVSAAISPFLRIATGKLIYASVLAALAALGW